MEDKTTDKKLKIILLYKSNYLANYYVREIGKLVKKSHVTLLPHLKELENDKILTSKKIGKNKIYSLNINNIIAKNYLELSEIFENIRYLEEVYLIKKITSEILNFQGTIVLFGSYSKRTFKKDSDIDIFYLGEIKQPEINKIKRIGKIYGKTINIKKSSIKNFEIGLRKKDPLIKEIIKNHIIIQNPGNFINILWRYFNEIK